MKKALMLVAVFGLLVSFSGSVKADECSVTTPCGNGNPEQVVGGWGTMNSEVPHVLPGQIVTDEGGVKSACPSWFFNYCVDITHTQSYRNSMLSLGRQLKALGVAGGMFGYWINLAQ